MKIIEKNLIYVILFFTFSVFLYINYRYLDIEFLAYTNGDEFMQFHSLYRMFEGFKTLNLENIFRFDSYVYGFIWHLINLVFTIPFHLSGNTEMAIFMPRVVNAIFSVSALFVIFLISRIFLNYFYSYGIVLFTLSMSGFFKSGYLFKPDVFQALLILISTYFLIKDNFAFKKYFYFGVLFFALSIGAAKIQAIMFMPLIYLYIGSKFIFSPSFKNLLFAIKNGFFSTLAIIAIFIITNPYLLNKRGFNAWFSMFTMNMDSNITNHGSYVNVTIMDKLFKVVDFYYIEIINFIILIAFCIYFLISIFRFKPLNTNNLRVFFVPLCASLISIIYLFLFVNKTWMNYYVSSIYLLVLILIPLFVLYKSKKLLFLMLALQIGGGISNLAYAEVFNKFNRDLLKAYEESNDLVENLKSLSCKNEMRILTDNPSFEYKKLNIDSRNIYQTFGAFKKDMYVLEEFLKKSNSKNIKYFYNPNVIILRKDNIWFSKNEEYEKRKDYKESIENIQELEFLGFKLKESKYFYIYAKGC